MIGRISGLLVACSPPQILVDCNGVGYEIDVPMPTFYELPAIGGLVTLFTHQTIREDSHQLYGFGNLNERSAFRQLTKVSGIGSKTALSVLSGMTVNELASAIARQDSARIIKVPGIGKKTAERLLLELKGKIIGDANGGGTPLIVAPMNMNLSDIENALISLGYSEKEAAAAVKLLPQDVGVSEGIKLSLKSLSKT